MVEPDFNFLVRQNERILTELRSVRDEMKVQTAMMNRYDHSIGDVLEELRAIHQWMVGVRDRVGKLEEANGRDE